MSGDEEGPLFRAMTRQAEAVDAAATPGERRAGWARLVPSALAAFGEGFLRDALVKGAVLVSLVVAVMGATSGSAGWIVAGLVAGIAGAVLPLVALARWSFGRQWAVILAVLVTQFTLMTAYWGTT